MPTERPLGERIDWTEARRPERVALRGAHVLLRPIEPASDAQPLYAVSHPPAGDPAIWTYLPDGPYESPEHLRQALTWARSAEDYVYFTLVGLPQERPLGLASYLRIAPEHGTIEIGHIWFAAQLQRTTAATEAIHLLARRAFDELGYRRLEWKCDALNAPSRRAALRLGFRFEGIFLNAVVYKQRSRDTAWFSVIDEEWPRVRRGLEAWLAPENFDAVGRQLHSLANLRAPE